MILSDCLDQSLADLWHGWKTKKVAYQPAGDDDTWGHLLGDVNISSRQKSQRPSHADSYDPWNSTTAPGTKSAAMPFTIDEPPPALPMSESDAITRAEKNSTEFLSTRDIATAARHFAKFPPGYQHFLVHALIDKAIFFEADASLVATLFDRVAASNLCSAAAFEDGFAPTTKHLAGITRDVPDALEFYARMFKGAHLDADADRCMRIVSISTDGEALMPLLCRTAAPAELVEPSPSPSPCATPNELDSESATTSPVPDSSADANAVVDDGASEPEPPCTVATARQASDDDDDLYADYTESCAMIPSLYTTLASATVQQRIIDLQEANAQPTSSQAHRQTKFHPVHVEDRVSEPPSPPQPASPNLPLARLRMPQKEAIELIEQTVAQLFGGPHDIDSALSVFAAVPPRHHSRLVDRLVSFAIESTRADAQLVAYFFYCAAAKGACAPAAFEGGFAVTGAALEDVAAESPDAVLLFATMAKGAGLHKDADWRKRFFGRLERLGYGPDLASLSR